jgi:hypothetical protein
MTRGVRIVSARTAFGLRRLAARTLDPTRPDPNSTPPSPPVFAGGER